ncbi:WbqC family protein [uncultured Prevotella sp.]|jgi:hypothetical protein|uniref:WbqC family protein n=1 Tax=uncultured Prevotella sp. TaxID=159272 RepID=UPI0025898DAE|nr:WbqC family protein [uncultured Prevotella sp.]
MTSVLLSTTYFGPVQWYQKLYRYDSVSIDLQETFQKQTYRNRCLIATTQGIQALTVPVVHDASNAIGDIRISDHGNWRHLHWQALQTAYGDSPFFEYYEDDLRPFFTERHWERLKDYNMSICQKMCELLDIQPTIVQTSDFRLQPSCPPSINPDDFRLGINPKHPLEDVDFQPKPYYQVYQQKHGFLPNLSILDLLFNMGPESIFYL